MTKIFHFLFFLINHFQKEYFSGSKCVNVYNVFFKLSLFLRLKYLARCDKEESNTKYLQYMKEVEVDWEKINEKIEEEYKKERVLKSSPSKVKKPHRTQ